ncbi:MAG: M13 family metallopeptidase [Christensenellaceae bacterium]|nr:M13 family metallopeptidase [Christensenellaceae bacterium]
MKKLIRSMLGIAMAVTLFAGNAMAVLAQAPSLKDDFYDAVNAEWYASAEIPADKPSTGGFMNLVDGVEKALMADFAAMLGEEKQPGNEQLSQFIEFYRLASDFETRDAAGGKPLLPFMERVEHLESLEDFAGQLKEWMLEGMPAPFGVFVEADMGNAAIHALYIADPGLFLMDKSYYADEQTKAALQGAYAQMSTKLLVMAGKTEAEAEEIVRQALAFDESLAPYTKSAEEASDYTKMYNPMNFSEFDAQIKSVNFSAPIEELLGEVPDKVIVANPDYFAAFDALVNDGTFPAMKSWMLVNTVNAFASYLSDGFRVEAGSFSRMLSGVAEAASREKSAYYLAAGTFSEPVGIYYGQTYFGEQAKQDVRHMVEAIIDTYKDRLSANVWLSDDTRATAISKLTAMAINVGYPDAARPIYSQIQIKPAAEGGTLIDNAMDITRLMLLDSFSKWNKPVDRGLWPLSGDTVNAMYSPMNNSINFPAAILQAPFYSLEQPACANYGGIGAVIAHEISHAFDPNGAKVDELGNLKNWWTQADYAKFEELSQTMVKEFDGLEHAGGVVNGTQTMAENVADAGGLACALEAAKREADVDLKALFTSWATIWRQKATPEYEALLLTLDVHAPSKLRANIQLQNMDDFHAAFDIREGDGMYRAPEERVIIW